MLRPEAGRVRKRRAGRAHPENVFFLLSLYIFFLFFPLFYSFLADLGKGDREAPLGRYGSPWVVAGDAGRGWDWGKYVKEPLLAVLGGSRAAARALRAACSRII